MEKKTQIHVPVFDDFPLRNINATHYWVNSVVSVMCYMADFELPVTPIGTRSGFSKLQMAVWFVKNRRTAMAWCFVRPIWHLLIGSLQSPAN